MAFLGGSWIMLRAQRRGFYKWLFLTVVAEQLLANRDECAAAPITLEFQATINRVFAGIPFDLGIEFAEGDEISGQFTFDPLDGDGNMSISGPQPYEFVLNINGSELESSGFEIVAVNNAAVEHFPLANSVDLVVVECGNSPVGCAPEVRSFPGGDPFRFGILLSLRSNAEVLANARHPGDPSVWNEFQVERQMNVSFVNVAGGGFGFQATVGQFAEVPEPACFTGITILLGLGLLNRRLHL